MTTTNEQKNTAPRGIAEIKLVIDNPETPASEKASYIALQQLVLSDKEEVIQRLNEKVQLLAGQVSSSRKLHAEYEIKISDLESQLLALTENPTYVVSDEELEQIKQLNHSVLELEAELDIAKAAHKQVSDEVVAVRAQNKTLRDQNSTLIAKEQHLSSQNNILESENSDLSQECMENSLEVIELKQKVKQFDQANNKLQNEVSGEAKRRENFLSVEMAKVQPVLDSVKSLGGIEGYQNAITANAEYKEKYSESCKKVTSLENELKKALANVDALKQRPIDLLEQNALLAEELMLANEQQCEMKSINTSLMANLNMANADTVYYQNMHQGEKGNADRLANIVGMVEKSVHLKLKDGIVYYLSNNTAHMDDDPEAKYPLYLMVTHTQGENIIIYSLKGEIKTICGSDIAFDDDAEKQQVKEFITRYTNQFIKEKCQLGLKAALAFGDASHEAVTPEMTEAVIATAKRISEQDRDPDWLNSDVNVARNKMLDLIRAYNKEIILLHGDKNESLQKAKTELVAQLKYEAIASGKMVGRVTPRAASSRKKKPASKPRNSNKKRK